MYERLKRLYNAKRLTKAGLKRRLKMDGSLKISTKKSRETSMSDFEIICRLCNAVNILSSIILEQQNLLEQSDIEKTIKDRFSMKYEDVEKNLDGII